VLVAQLLFSFGFVEVHDEAQMPFGGVKASGIGRFGGKAGVPEFTELRWITMQTSPRHYPF
jgi:acyl-CoA reductase-like NAD-dependent aldehyde dehydrogenase